MAISGHLDGEPFEELKSVFNVFLWLNLSLSDILLDFSFLPTTRIMRLDPRDE